MGDFWDFLNPSTWSTDLTLSPVYQSVVGPALNVAGAAIGIPAAGNILGGVTHSLSSSPTPQAPAGGSGYVAPKPAAPAVKPPMSDTMKIALGAGGLVVLGTILYFALREKPQHSRA